VETPQMKSGRKEAVEGRSDAGPECPVCASAEFSFEFNC